MSKFQIQKAKEQIANNIAAHRSGDKACFVLNLRYLGIVNSSILYL